MGRAAKAVTKSGDLPYTELTMLSRYEAFGQVMVCFLLGTDNLRTPLHAPPTLFIHRHFIEV
jgi:hypothetical protein